MLTEAIEQALYREATQLWVMTYTEPNHRSSQPVLLRSLDEATVYVHEHVAKGLHYYVDIKSARDDDAMSPDGAITGLGWYSPLRRMTDEECLAACSRFGKEWVEQGTPPNTPDWGQATRAGVKFVRMRVSTVLIHRLSRYLGYLERSGALNDKRRDWEELGDAWLALERVSDI